MAARARDHEAVSAAGLASHALVREEEAERCPPAGRTREPGDLLSLIDRYLLRLAFWPMLGVTGVTLMALLLERTLRMLDVLSASSDRFGYVAQLAVNLVPHYMGLTLPTAFFIALIIVVNRMNQSSEVDALLAAGVSLTRLAAPYLWLSAVLAVVSLATFGFLQPYSRYAFRAVMHAAENSGWNGRTEAGVILTPSTTLTVATDDADPAGERLSHVFIRRLTEAGREEITTAGSAIAHRALDGRSVRLDLRRGRQLRFNARGQPQVLTFQNLTMQLPISAPAKLLRGRGGDERELTIVELARQAWSGRSMIPRAALKSELYGRIARTLSLPLLPLLAIPLGLSAKRSGRAPGMIVGGLVLLAFHHLVQLGQSLAAVGRAPAELAVGGPFLAFGAICLGVFFTSGARPGENPVSRSMERLGSLVARLRAGKAAGATA